MEASGSKSNLQVTLFFPGGMRTEFWNGREPANYDRYNDPKKVATKMLELVAEQKDTYDEFSLPRGGELV